MHFTLCLPIDDPRHQDELITGPAVADVARAAEDAGFAAVNLTDHPMPPDRWLAGGGHHALDPLVALAFAAAATTRLRLHTHVIVLGYRNPFLLAKGVMTLDRLSGGRVILGVAAGYLRPEFQALGVSHDERGALADEAIRAMKAAWTGESVDVAGLHFEAHGHTMRPRPVQQPHPPIWIGGNSRQAIRRAVDLGDGWVPFPNPASAARFVRTPPLETTGDLAGRLAYLREYAASVGREPPRDVCFSPLLPAGERDDPARLRDHVAELAGLGVTWMATRFAETTRAGYLESIRRFGADVLSRL
jgi:probable F420-dependent oxidoreductase